MSHNYGIRVRSGAAYNSSLSNYRCRIVIFKPLRRSFRIIGGDASSVIDMTIFRSGFIIRFLKILSLFCISQFGF